MRYEIEYQNLKERQNKVAEAEAKGWRMIHDNFAKDLKTGEETRGVMIFADEPSVAEPSLPVRNLVKELDELKMRVEKLEGR